LERKGEAGHSLLGVKWVGYFVTSVQDYGSEQPATIIGRGDDVIIFCALNTVRFW
jgi:hypothetical protein